MQVVVNSLLVSYKKTGRGKIVLMLHGWADNSGTFNELAKELSSKFTVIIPDLPGFGASQAPPVPWELSDYAKFVADFMEKLGAKDIYMVIAHSNGGAVAIKGLANNFFKAEKLVLFSSAGIRNRGRGKKLAFKLAAKAGKAPARLLPKRLQLKLRRGLYKAAGSDMLVAEHLSETFKKTTAEDVLQIAKRLSLPTLLIYGDNDTDTPPSDGKLFNTAIKKSKLKIISEGRHFLHQENAQEVLKAIKEFVG